MGLKEFLSAMTLKAKIIAASVAVVAVAAAAVTIAVLTSGEDAYRVLKVFEMDGESSVLRNGSVELDAYVGMNLESGDVLTVGEDSTLRMILDNDKYVLLDGGTVLELVATGSAADSRTLINLMSGTILNELTKPLSANSSYEVSTPKSTMAVRGTSFIVSVEQDENGGYTIREMTLDGVVEVELIDSEGNRTGEIATVTADNAVTIRTEPNETSGNPAEIDGTSRFVLESEEGVISELSGGSPIHDINYGMLSQAVRETALYSNDTSLMLLDEEVVRKLRGEAPTDEPSDDSEPTGEGGAPESGPASEAVTDPATGEPTEETAEVTEPVIPSEETPEDTTAPPESLPADGEPATPDTTTAGTDGTTAATDATTAETASETASSTTAETTAATTAVTGGTSSITGGSSGISASYYNVYFYDENGELLKTLKVISGGTAGDNLPAVPEKDGYYGEWISNDRLFTADTVIRRTTDVTATYTPLYTLTFVAGYDESVILGTQTLLEGETPEYFAPDTIVDTDADGVYDYILWCWDGDSPEATSTDGDAYLLSGWKDMFDAIAVNDDMTVVIPYKPYDDIYEVQLVNGVNLDNAEIVLHKLFAEGDSLTFPTPGAVELPEGYEFTGWGEVTSGQYSTALKPGNNDVFDYGGGSILGERFQPGESVTLSGYGLWGGLKYGASYEPIDCKVTFVEEDGSTVVGTAIVSYGYSINYCGADMPTVPEKEFYDGVWMYNGEEFTADTVVEDDITVTASYTLISHTVTFMADGKEVTTAEVTHGEALGTNLPAVPEKTGYVGVWMLDGAEFTEDAVIESDITVTAEYTRQYTVTFVASYDETTAVETQTILEGETLTYFEPDVVVDTNGDGTYEYILWCWEKDGSPYDGVHAAGETDIGTTYLLSGWKDMFDAITVTDDMTVTIPYQNYDDVNEVAFGYYWDDQGLAVSYRKLVLVGDSLIVPSNNGNLAAWTQYQEDYSSGFKPGSAEKEVGWSTTTVYYSGDKIVFNEARGFAFNMGPMPNSTTYTVTFLDENGDELYVRTVIEGGAMGNRLPAAPTKDDGFTWVWGYTAEDGNVAEFTSETVVTADMTVTATKAYTVNFVTGYDGEVFDTQTVIDGGSPTYVTVNTIVDTNGDGSYDYILWPWDGEAPYTTESDGGTYLTDAWIELFNTIEVSGNEPVIEVTIPYKAYNSVYEIGFDAPGGIQRKLFVAGESVTLLDITDYLPAGESIDAYSYEFTMFEGEYSSGFKPGTTEVTPTELSSTVYKNVTTAVINTDHGVLFGVAMATSVVG